MSEFGTQENQKCAMNIVLIDDTALIETASVRSGREEEKEYGFVENMKKEERGEDAVLVGATSIGNGRGNEKEIVGFAKNLKKQESDQDRVPIEATSIANGRGNEGGIVGFAENSRKQETDEDTVLIDTLSIRNVYGQEKEIMGFADCQENNGKKGKRCRRRGKGKNKCARTSENEKVVTTQMAEYQFANGCEKKIDGTKFLYSRKEMEALRFANVGYQKKKWFEVYCGLEPVVTKEYDGLVDCNRHKKKQNCLSSDAQQNFKTMVAAPGILGEVCNENLDSEMIMSPLDSASGLIVTDVDGCTAVEEECSEDDDSDAEYSSIQRPAFLVTGAPDFDSGPPLDGLEYLRRVRWEAKQFPKVKVAKVEESKLNKEQTVYMPTIPDIATCPEHLLPLKEWEVAFLDDFSKLRLALSWHEGGDAEFSSKLQPVSKILEEEDGKLMTEGVDGIDGFSAQSSAADVSDAFLSLSSPKSTSKADVENCPTLSTILGMDSVARVSMLRKRIKSVEMMTHLSRDDCAWLFALCAAVDAPLNADTCAALRGLLRKCASLRAEKSELDDEVVMLNMLATISGKYFGQSEK